MIQRILRAYYVLDTKELNQMEQLPTPGSSHLSEHPVVGDWG